MTGKELIIYILQNNLVKIRVFEDGSIPGFVTADEAAVAFKVGKETIKMWYELGHVDGIKIGNVLYIQAVSNPIKNNIKRERVSHEPSFFNERRKIQCTKKY